jgi:predicted ATPase/DNA-binding XRE family transcriptional regulator
MQEETSFGKWLRKQRRALDLSRQALADQAGCAEVTLRRIEAGTLKPSRELASILLEQLGIPELKRERWISFARGTGSLPTEHPVAHDNQPVTNLPAALTSFIGREKEQADVIRLLDKHRLVTLTGSGGVGKSRLSIKIGEQVLENYAHGVWFIELASLNNPVLLPQTVIALFGISPQSDIPYMELLVNFLRLKSLLLILDNCEHLVDGCAHFTDLLLKSCPGLKILATSREPIGVLGEALYRVPSLGLPAFQQLPILGSLKEVEAIRLFEERARLAQFDFSLTSENVSAVAQICQRLDGIPLAIELAAAKVGVLSVEQIAQQLEESFNLLTGGSRTVLPRHYTLSASMDWSWGLLTEPEQTLMCQLCVFVGGWTLEAAQAVCDGDVLELINSLVRKSLIVVNEKAGRDTRYYFHEVVRQYAREKFIEAGEEENIRTRHMQYFLRLTKRAEPKLKGPNQIEWFERLKDERDNLRAALGWADQTDVEAGLYLSSRLGTSWHIFDLREESHWLSKFLQKTESHSYPRARIKALSVHGLILLYLQQLDAVLSVANEGLELSRALGDQEGEVDTLLLLSPDSWPNVTGRMKLAQRALKLAESLGDVSRQVEALWQLGYSVQAKSRFIYWQKAIDLARFSGDGRWLADGLSEMAFEFLLIGDVDSAQKCLDESEMLYQRFNMDLPSGILLTAHGQIALMRGDYKKGRAYFQKSARMFIEYGNRHDYLWAHVRVGYVALREGNVTEAQQIFTETAQDFQKDNVTLGAAFALEGMAGIHIGVNKPDYAARLIGWADATREKFGDLRPPLEQADVDKIIAACIVAMGEAAYGAEYAEGSKLTLDEAVAYALEG